jgi:hypothetical protein
LKKEFDQSLIDWNPFGHLNSASSFKTPMTIFDDKNLELRESFIDLIYFLEKEGIPKDSLVKFSSEFPFCRAFNMVKPSELLEDWNKMKDILQTCQEYSKCYPYMNTSKLIEKIHQNWDNLSSCYGAGRDHVKKKLEKIKKKDPKVIETLTKGILR